MMDLRRLLRIAVPAAVIAVVALFAVPALDRVFRAKVTTAIAEAKASIESQLGLSISFSSLSPSILHSVAFSSVTLRDPEGRVFLEARRVRVYYDLFAALRGDAVNFLKTIEIDDATGDVVLPRDNAILARLASLIFPPAGFPAPRFRLVGKGLQLRLKDTGLGSLDLSARDLSYSSLGQTIDVSLSGGYALTPEHGSIGSIEGPLELRGSLSQDASMARAQIALAGSAPNFSFSTQRFELVYSKGLMELRKVRDKAPIDAYLAFDPHDDSLSASLRMDHFVPESSVHLRGGLSSFAPWLWASYSGTIAFKLPAGDIGRAGYSLNLETSLPKSILSRPYRLSISANGDLRQARIAYLRLAGQGQVVAYRGAFNFHDLSPDGTLNLALTLREGTLPVSASFRLYGHDGIYTALAQEVAVSDAVFRDLSITAALRKKVLEFQASLRPPEGESSTAPIRRFSGEGGVASGVYPRISIDGSVDLGAKPTIDVSATLDEVDLEPLRGLLANVLDSPRAVSLLGSLKLSGEFFATSDFSRLSWSASDLAIVSHSVPGAYALLSLSGDLQDISVRSFLVSAAGYTVRGSGSVDFAVADRLGFAAKFDIRGIPYQLRGTVIGGSVFVTGDYGLSIATRTEGAATFFSAKAASLPIPLADGIALVGIDADGRFASISDWSVALNRLDLAPSDEKTSLLPRLEIAGVLGPSSARLDPVSVEDRYSRLSGSVSLGYTLVGPLSAHLEADLRAVRGDGRGKEPSAAGLAGSVTGSPGVQSGGGGTMLPLPGESASSRERYVVTMSYSQGALSGEVDFSSSPVRRLGLARLAGSLDGKVAVGGTLTDPHLSFDAVLHDGSIGPDPLSFTLKGHYSGKTVDIENLSAAYKGQRIRSGSIVYSFADASAALSLDCQGIIGGKVITVSLEANGSSAVSGSAGSPVSGPAQVGVSVVGEQEANTGQSAPGNPVSSSAPPKYASSAQPAARGRPFALLNEFPAQLRNYRLSGMLLSLAVGGVKVERWPFSLSLSPSRIAFDGGPDGEFAAVFEGSGKFAINSTTALPVAFTASGSLSGASIDARIDKLDINLAAISPVLPLGTTTFDAGRLRGSLVVDGLLADPEISGILGVESVVVSVPDWLSAKVGPVSFPVSVSGKSIAFGAIGVPAGKARLDISATADLDHWIPSHFKAHLSTGNGPPVDLNLVISGVQIKGQAYVDLTADLRADVIALSGSYTLQRSSVVIGTEVLGGGEAAPSNPPSYPLLVQAQIRFGRGVEVFFPSKSLPVVTGYADPISSLSINYDQSVEELSMKGSVTLRGGDVFYIQRSFFLKSGLITFNETLDHFDPRVTMLAELRDSTEQGPVLITLRTDNQPISSFKPILSSNPPMSEAEIASVLGAGLFDVSGNQTIDIRKAVISSSEFLPQLSVARAFEQRIRDTLGLDVFFLQTQFLQRWLIDISTPGQSSATDPLARYLNQTSLYAGKYIGDSVFLHGELRFQQDPLVSTEPLRIDSELGIEFDTPFGNVQWTIAPTHPDTLYVRDQSLSVTWRLSY